MDTNPLSGAFNFAGVLNPYDFANPVSQERMFAGRQKELQDIDYYLDYAAKADKPINLALIGDRAAGKTSLLNMTQNRATQQDKLVVRIDLDESDAVTELAFFYKALDSIVEAACQIGAFGGFQGHFYDSYRTSVDSYIISEDPIYHVLRFPLLYARALGGGHDNVAVPASALVHDLRRILAEVGRTIVVLLDECDVLKNSQSQLQKLRNTLQNREVRKYMVVLAGTPGLIPSFNEVFSPMTRQFKKLQLLPFEETTDTEQCVLRPLEQIGVEYPRSLFHVETLRDIQDIHDVSGGRPYEINLLCHFMFKRLQSGVTKRMELTLDVLNDVMTELESSQDVSLRPLIHSVQEYSRKDLRSLGTLGACCGHATFEDMMFLDRVFAKQVEVSHA